VKSAAERPLSFHSRIRSAHLSRVCFVIMRVIVQPPARRRKDAPHAAVTIGVPRAGSRRCAGALTVPVVLVRRAIGAHLSHGLRDGPTFLLSTDRRAATPCRQQPHRLEGKPHRPIAKLYGRWLRTPIGPANRYKRPHSVARFHPQRVGPMRLENRDLLSVPRVDKKSDPDRRTVGSALYRSPLGASARA
jgi:hypothetical protein